VRTIAPVLEAAGVGHAAGFALDTSGFDAAASEDAYGNQISAALHGAHFVVDTSRDGAGSAAGNEWCNPAGRALGVPATTATGDGLADADLWFKTPGESDGTCNGGPAAGQWWTAYAVGLAERAGY
jgi:endoglucanase